VFDPLCPSPTKAWLESGPFTWFAPPEEQISIEDKLDSLQRALVDLSIAAGTPLSPYGSLWL
jgi:hypothetical protein